jgi:hypothetical protein
MAHGTGWVQRQQQRIDSRAASFKKRGLGIETCIDSKNIPKTEKPHQHC